MGIIAGLTAALLFAIANVLVRSQADRIDMLSVNAIRLAVASPIALLAPIVLGLDAGSNPTAWQPWVFVFIGSAISLAIGDTIYYQSQRTLGMSRAQPIANIYPIWTLMLAALFLGEQPTWTLGAAIILVLMGVYLLVEQRRPQADLLTLEKRALYPSLAMAVGAGICWAIGTTFFRQGMQGLNFTTVNQVRIPAMAVMMLALGPIVGRPIRPRAYGRRTMSMIALVGVLGMGFGSLLFLFSLQDLGATKAALISSLSPFFGVPLAAAFLSEKITRRRALGMVFCVAAVWLVLSPF